MKNILKRLGSLALALIMVLSLVPFDGLHTHVHAATEETAATAATNEVAPAAVTWTEVGKFTDFQKAIAAGGNIKLTAGFKTTAKLDLTKDVTIDFNGCTVELYNGTSYPFEIKAHVTLQDTSKDGKGGLHLDGGARSHQMIRVNSGSLTVKSGHYELRANHTSIAHTIYGWRPITIEGGTIKVTSSKGYVDKNNASEIRALTIGNSGKEDFTGSLTVTGGNFIAERDEGLDANTYGIAVLYSTAKLSGCTVSVKGPGVKSYSLMAVRIEGVADTTGKAKLEISSGTYTSDKKSGNAYTVYASGTGPSEAVITGGTFQNNTGTIVNAAKPATAPLTISGGTFQRFNGNKYTLAASWIPEGHYQDSVGTVFEDKHQYATAQAGKAANCLEDGWATYYLCDYCGTYVDENRTTIGDAAAVEGWKLNAGKVTGTHAAEHVEAKAPIHTQEELVDGNTEYWHCAICGGYWSDSDLTTSIQLNDTVVKAGHTFVNGTCTGCGLESCKEGHTFDGELIAQVDATCMADGRQAYYVCTVCESAYTTAEGTEISWDQLTIPATDDNHVNLHRVDKVDATLYMGGHEAYWTCNCGKLYADADGVQGEQIDKIPEIDMIPTVAMIGETDRFATLQAAVDACGNGGTIKLVSDTTLTAAVPLPYGKTRTIDLAGHTIDVGSYNLTNAGNLTITDSVGSGKIIGTSILLNNVLGSGQTAPGTMVIEKGAYTSTGTRALVISAGTATIKDGDFSIAEHACTTDWNVIRVESGATCNIEGGTIRAKANTGAKSPVAVYSEGTLIVGKATIDVDSVGQTGGNSAAILTKKGTVTLTGTTITVDTNQTGGNPYGLYLNSGTTSCTINSGTSVKLTYTKGTRESATIFASADKLTINGGTISNTSSGAGYAIRNYKETVIDNGTFNVVMTGASANGQVINMASADGTVTINNGEFTAIDMFRFYASGSSKDDVMVHGGTFKDTNATSIDMSAYYEDDVVAEVRYGSDAKKISVCNSSKLITSAVNTYGKDGTAKVKILKDFDGGTIKNEFKTSVEIDLNGKTWTQSGGNAIEVNGAGTTNYITKIHNGTIKQLSTSGALPIRVAYGALQVENVTASCAGGAVVGYCVLTEDYKEEYGQYNWIDGCTLVSANYFAFSFHVNGEDKQKGNVMTIENSTLVTNSTHTPLGVYKAKNTNTVILGENVNMYTKGNSYGSTLTTIIENAKVHDMVANQTFGEYTGLNMWTTNHTYGDATCEAGPTCSCGAVNGDPKGHAYPDTWTNAGDSHKKVCANGCGEDIVEAHEYVYANTGIGTCVCGATTTCQHSYTYTPNGDATCKADGTKHGVCSNCGNEVNVPDEGSKLPHTEATKTELIKAATCGEDGSHYEITYCSVCNEELDRETVTDAATGAHTEETKTELIAAPTCEQDGSHYVITYCTTCNKELKRETVTDPKTGHTYTYTSNNDKKTHTIGCQVGDYNATGDCVDADKDKFCDLCQQKLLEPKVTVNGVEYETFEEAWANVTDGAVVKVLEGLFVGSITENFTVSGNVTLDLNGHYLIGNVMNDYGMFYVRKGAKLTVKNGDLTNNTTYAIGNYGEVVVEANTNVWGDDAAIYNFYFAENFYGKTDIAGYANTIWNSGELTVAEGGVIEYLDNSGYAAIEGTVLELYIGTGEDAPAVPNAGVIAGDLTDVTLDYDAENYKLVTENGENKLVARVFVAEVNGTKYETLAEALAADGEIKLIADIDAKASGVIIAVGETIDLNGHTLTADILTTIKMNGGTFKTGKYTMVGADGLYNSADAVFTVSGEKLDVTVHSGTMSLNQAKWYTGEGQTLKIEKNATFVIPENCELYVNGSNVIVEGTAANFGTLTLANGAHVKGDIAGTFRMAGGTFETSQYVMIGATEGRYISSDAVFTITPNKTMDMTVVSGTITLNDADWWTLQNQTLVIAKDAKFVVPAGKNINVQGTVIVEGTAVTDGTVTLYNENATIKAAADLNVISKQAKYAVVYENGTYSLTEAVAVLNNTGYATFAEALAAAQAGDTITVLKTAVIDSVTTIRDITIKTNGADPAIRIVNNAFVAIDNVTMDTEGYAFILGASDGSSAGNLHIYSGNFHSDVSVVSVTKGELVIRDGEFSAEPYQGNYAYLINCIDANYKNGTATVTIRGGKFHNWDPANNAAEGPDTCFVTKEFASVQAGETYQVVKAEAFIGNTGYATFAEALAAAQAGETVTLLKDVTCGSAILIDKAITLDGNDKTLTSTATRAINVDCAEAVEIKDLTIATTTDTERAINVIQKAAELTLTNVTAEGFKYTLNVAGSSVGSEITVNGGKLSGYAAVNISGNDTVLTVNDAELIGVNDVPFHESNAFGVIAMYPGTTGVKVTVNGGSLTATSENGNRQFAVAVAGAEDTEITVLATLNLVNGDVFNGDPEKISASFLAEYADELLAQGFMSETASVAGLVKVTEAAAASVNGIGYTDLQDALDAAEAAGGATVVIVNDQELKQHMMVGELVTLDLNGKCVSTTKTFTVYGDVIDGDVGGNGVLSASRIHVAGEQSFLPIYDNAASGYRFYKHELQNLGGKVGEGQVTFGIRLNFANAKAYEQLGKMNAWDLDPHLQLTANVRWTGLGGTVEYTFQGATLIGYAKAAAADIAATGTTAKAITLTIKGLDKLSQSGAEISMQPEITTDTGIGAEGNIFAYTVS